MRIRVNKILTDKPEVTVLFITDYGDAKALWVGDTPIENQEYYVEVDVNDTLAWGKDVIEAENYYTIRLEDDQVYISGILESVDSDGYTVLRIGESFIPFMASGHPLLLNSLIELSTRSVSLTPIDY